jgi:hypothetical protein
MLNPARSTMRGTIPIAHADHDTHKTHTHCVLLLYALTTCGYAESRAKRRTSVRRTTLHIVPVQHCWPNVLRLCTSSTMLGKWVCKMGVQKSIVYSPPAGEKNCLSRAGLCVTGLCVTGLCVTGLCVTGLCVTGAPGSENGTSRRPLNQKGVCKNRSYTRRPPARRTVLSRVLLCCCCLLLLLFLLLLLHVRHHEQFPRFAREKP